MNAIATIPGNGLLNFIERQALHAGEKVAGVVLSNPAPHLTLRTR
jgi:hypothetical protein